MRVSPAIIVQSQQIKTDQKTGRAILRRADGLLTSKRCDAMHPSFQYCRVMFLTDGKKLLNKAESLRRSTVTRLVIVLEDLISRPLSFPG